MTQLLHFQRMLMGAGIRIVERTFGHDHNGGTLNLFLLEVVFAEVLEESGLPVKVEHSSVFWRNCRE